MKNHYPLRSNIFLLDYPWEYDGYFEGILSLELDFETVLLYSYYDSSKISFLPFMLMFVSNPFTNSFQFTVNSKSAFFWSSL